MECGAGIGECKVWSVTYSVGEVWNVECKLPSVECKVWSVKCRGVLNVKCRW